MGSKFIRQSTHKQEKNLYDIGYKVGYQKGYKAGQEIPSETIIDTDLVYVYGMMGIILKERGHSEKYIEKLMKQIQEAWVAEYKCVDEARKEGRKTEYFPDKVQRITGINLLQIFGLDAEGIEK